MNPNLEHFKQYNQVGVRRKYLPSKKRLEKFKYNNEWECDEKQNVFTLRDYKCCYITIMKNKNGKYQPSINGSSVNAYPNIIELNKEYETLDDAKDSAFLFVDKITASHK